MRASSSFMREVGSSIDSCSALLALRMRVSMSAMGSVNMALLLPRRFGHAGDLALVRELAQADAADAELAEDGARAAAPPAARVGPDLVPLRPGGLRDHGLLRHYWEPPGCANGRPRPRRSAKACSSVSALVVIATSRPRI